MNDGKSRAERLADTYIAQYAKHEERIDVIKKKLNQKNTLFDKMVYHYVYAITLYERSAYSQMIEHVKITIQISNQLDEVPMLIRSYNILGITYAVMGLLSNALESYLMCIELAKLNDTKRLLASVYNNIGEIYYEMNAIDKAREFYQRSYDSYKEMEAVFLNSQSYHIAALNLAEIFIIDKAYERAKQMIDKALSFSIDNSKKQMVAFCHNILLEYYYRLGDYDQMTQVFLDTKVLYRDISNKRYLLKLTLKYCQYRLDLDMDIIPTIEYLKYAEEQAITDNTTYDTQKTMSLLAHCYTLTKEHEQAYQYYTKYTQHFKNNQKNANEQKLASLQMRLDIEVIEYERSLIDRKNQELVKNEHHLKQALERIKAINSVGQKLTSITKFELLVKSIYESIKSLMPVFVFYIYIVDADRKILIPSIYIETDKVYDVEIIAISDPTSLAAKCVREKAPIINNDAWEVCSQNADYFPHVKGDYTKSYIFVPFEYEGEVIGVYSIQSSLDNSYNEDQVGMALELAPFISIAVNNAKYARRLEREIQDRKEYQNELEHINKKFKIASERDGLTGVYNRRILMRELNAYFNTAIVTRQLLGIYIIDIDYFKTYNDHYGHMKGDEILKQIAFTLNEAFNESNQFLARYGGEEFVGVFIGKNREEIIERGHSLLRKVERLELEHLASPIGAVSISIGLAFTIPNSNISYNDVLECADSMLYNAKKNGRNCLRYTQHI